MGGIFCLFGFHEWWSTLAMYDGVMVSGRTSHVCGRCPARKIAP